jgi:hypothetical protein
MDLWPHKKKLVQNDDIHERLGVSPVEEKFMQHCLRWFGHMQRRLTEALIRNGVIRWTGNKKRDRGRPNLTWEKFVKRDLKDWCITNELALDRREWNVAIHVSEPWCSVTSFYCLLSDFFPTHFSLFDLTFYCFFFFFDLIFLSPFIFPLRFHSCFVPFLTHVVSSLSYPNLLRNKRLGCYLLLL